MKNLGLALSGGGLRATLYHLGVVRYLSEAGILPQVSQITSVSGGSILAAHLVLNWDKYCGSPSQFDAAAAEILEFVQIDVRNRVVRRFPLASTVNTMRRVFRLRAKRQLTRAGLLEKQYEQYLYGDKSLFELPEKPRLHMLSTNVSEGGLCAFHRGGMLQQRRSPGRRDRFEKSQIGLATIPMAVAASSAFPGFFPPLELNAWDVGAEEGEFSRQAFTDGGIFDNLGLRMFRCIEQSWIRDTAPLGPNDVLELEAVISALTSGKTWPDDTPMRRLSELVTRRKRRAGAKPAAGSKPTAKDVIGALWDVIRSEELFRDPVFQQIDLIDPGAQSLLHYVTTSGHEPEMSDRLWLNRQIVESALQQIIGKPCLRPNREGFDCIMVSDAGKKFRVNSDGRAGGLIRTGLRSTDILMDRVYQLEMESFVNSQGVLFFPLMDIVDQSDDSDAPHPEVQRQTARIRTDLDRFSELEISALVQHGYCVARKTCQQRGGFGGTSPTGPPWDPYFKLQSGRYGDEPEENPLGQTETALAIARKLRRSAVRRIGSTLFDFRDWPTYAWLALISCVVLIVAILVPYNIIQSNQHARQQAIVLEAISDTSPTYRELLSYLENGPITSVPEFNHKEVDSVQPTDFSGFEIISDTRLIDLRAWTSPTIHSAAPFVHTRARIRRTEIGSENTHLRFQFETPDDKLHARLKSPELRPKLLRYKQPDGNSIFELDLDFSHVPVKGDAELILEEITPSNMAGQRGDEGHFRFSVLHDTGLVQVWMLMPEGRQYEYFEIAGHPLDEPDNVQVIEPEKTVQMPLGALAMFRLINPKANYRYECRWNGRTKKASRSDNRSHYWRVALRFQKSGSTARMLVKQSEPL